MILLACYYAEHRCKLFRVTETPAGVLRAVPVEASPEFEGVPRLRLHPTLSAERWRALAGEPFELAGHEVERLSGLRMPVAADWIRDHL